MFSDPVLIAFSLIKKIDLFFNIVISVVNDIYSCLLRVEKIAIIYS